MAPSRELRGRPAAPGIALGPLVRLGAAIAATAADRRSRATSAARWSRRSPARSAISRRCRRARPVRTARRFSLSRSRCCDDEALREPALERDRAKAPPRKRPGRPRCRRQIADYEAADDEYFRARASDLRDLRDRVLGASPDRRGGAPRAPGAILAGEDIAPSRLSRDGLERRAAASRLSGGSPSSHVAILARARGVPMVVGLGGDRVRRPSARSWSTAKPGWSS